MGVASTAPAMARLPERSAIRDWSWICALAGFIAAGIFAIILYPRLAGAAGAVLDPDGYGALGWGVWKFHTLSYYPDTEPMITRGPLYPGLIGALLTITGGWYPYSIQIVQICLFAGVCYTAARIATRLWGPGPGRIAGLACAVHPLLVWYTSRIWVESLAIFLFTSMVLALMRYRETQTWMRAAVAGTVVGLACLCKGTFLPFVAVVPALMWILSRHAGLLRPAAAGLIAVAIIAPWTLRNWNLTGQLIPVHGQFGFNMRTGDLFFEHLSDSPWTFVPQWNLATAEAAALEQQVHSQGLSGWKAETRINEEMLARARQTWASDRLFLVRKSMFNAAAFWAWSETRGKTLGITVLQIPLLCAFFWWLATAIRRGQVTGPAVIPLALSFVFFASHLPILAAARYSAVVLPSMLALCSGLFSSPKIHQTL